MSKVNDIQNFELFFKAHYRGLCFFAQGILTNKETAEDIVQESFMKYMDRQTDFETDIAALSFLYTTIRNASFNYLRHLKVEERHKHEPVPLKEDPVALQAIIKSEAMGQIYKAIETLPTGCRTIFHLGYIEELKNQEIADHLQISINTVKTQKARALQLLRLKLNPEDLVIFLLAFEIKSFLS